MTYDDWKTTDPADRYDDRDDDRDDVPEYLDEPAEAPAQTTPHSERCEGCAGTGWAGGVEIQGFGELAVTATGAYALHRFWLSVLDAKVGTVGDQPTAP